MRPYLTAIPAIVILLISGCSSKNEDGNNNRKISESSYHNTSSYPVELIDQIGLNKLINDRNGMILVLNIWATWCQPCVEEFPDLIKLSRSDSLIEVVGISVDYPDEIDSKVTPFLKKLNVPFKIYIAKFDNQEDFINAIDKTWSGAVPATYIYDRMGKKKLSIIGRRTYSELNNYIRKFKNEKSRS